ncbi:hypothetical protein Thena_1258 [Thermodesulfobium narugense DSM 14796]|uniref:Metal dependent phosphohydrolase n=1 Tax=Thermodesulfobium narugense DSM 14796 TaxID=747365 RepID=M1E580_9BACT|nr:hypothetical protein [Thermodesulfobium narugense]AEE14877.1 hypothetical protein Thena_1258 [Thermodesulfobium narugense DSM 14796]
MDRRDFFKLIAILGASTFVTKDLIWPQDESFASTKSISFKDCLTMTPEEMAKNSNLVQKCWNFNLELIDKVKDLELKNKLKQAWLNPVPTFYYDYNSSELEKIKNLIIDRGFVEKTWDFPKPIKEYSSLASPGSGYESHHSYPGGLVVHVAENLGNAKGIIKNYEWCFKEGLDNDVVIAAQVLHDLEKPWVFQWLDEGSSRPELQFCKTGEHHIYSIAEAIKRGFEPKVVIAQACAHEHPGSHEGEKLVATWILAGSILAGIDPVKNGFLDYDNDGNFTLPKPFYPEWFITHLGDHDYVLTVFAAKSSIKHLSEVAVSTYNIEPKGKEFNILRNYLFSEIGQMGFYFNYVKSGKDNIKKLITNIVSV